jgi:hypothetical protein
MPHWNIITWIIIVSVLLIGIISLSLYISSSIARRNKELLETVTRSNRGTATERVLVLNLLKNGIPAQTIFHDLYVRKPNGIYSQIDLVVVTSVGVIVFEVKELSGWIFGNGNHSQWTQVLAYGKEKFRFYNPIMQNNNHIQILKKQLKQFEKIPFFSIVVFYGDCVLKEVNFIPNGTFLVKWDRVIEVMKKITNENILAPYTNKREVVNLLKSAVLNGENEEIIKQHIKNIKDMLGKERIFD